MTYKMEGKERRGERGGEGRRGEGGMRKRK